MHSPKQNVESGLIMSSDRIVHTSNTIRYFPPYTNTNLQSLNHGTIHDRIHLNDMIPHVYTSNIVQYIPQANKASPMQYPLQENSNRLSVPVDMRRPSSAPLVPVEPKKIGRRCRRSSSAEEPTFQSEPSNFQEIEKRKQTFLPRHVGEPYQSYPNTSQFSNMGNSSSHEKPANYDFQRDYNVRKAGIDAVGMGNAKPCNYRPYLDTHPINNAKKNLFDKFVKRDGDTSFDSSIRASIPSSETHPSAMANCAPSGYSPWNQYSMQQAAGFHNKTNMSHSQRLDNLDNSSLFNRTFPTHETRPVKQQLITPKSEPGAHLTERDKDAPTQAMNTYFELLASGQHKGTLHEGWFLHQNENVHRKNIPYATSSQENVGRSPAGHNALNMPHPSGPCWMPDKKDFIHSSKSPLDAVRSYPGGNISHNNNNEPFKPSEGNCGSDPRYPPTAHKGYGERIQPQDVQSKYETQTPYETFKSSTKIHPPHLVSYIDSTRTDYASPIGHNRSITDSSNPPLLKIETPKEVIPPTPIQGKKRPRPGPIIIPPTVNNKYFLTPGPNEKSNLTMAHSVYTPPAMLSPKSIFFNPPLSLQRLYTPLALGFSSRSSRRNSIVEQKDLPQSAESTGVEAAIPPIEIPEPKINIGEQFQAVVPILSDQSEAHKDIHRASLMWSPLKEDKKKNCEVIEYLDMACSLALYGGSSNREYALHILQRTRGNVKEATRLLLSRRHILRADDPNADYHYSGSVRWNAKERLAFRQAFHQKGKIFMEIQKEVDTKSIQLCVEFYYLWKAMHPESFRARSRMAAEVESEQDEEEVPPTPTAAVAPLSTLREPVFECDYPGCLARFISRQALNGHIRVHGGSYSKSPDQRRTKEKNNLNSPETGSVASAVNSPPKRKKHNQPSSTIRSSDGTLQFQCRVCARVFSKVKSRSAHMKTHVKSKKGEKDAVVKAAKPSVITNQSSLCETSGVIVSAANLLYNQ